MSNWGRLRCGDAHRGHSACWHHHVQPGLGSLPVHEHQLLPGMLPFDSSSGSTEACCCLCMLSCRTCRQIALLLPSWQSACAVLPTYTQVLLSLQECVGMSPPPPPPSMCLQLTCFSASGQEVIAGHISSQLCLSAGYHACRTACKLWPGCSGCRRSLPLASRLLLRCLHPPSHPLMAPAAPQVGLPAVPMQPSSTIVALCA